MITGRFLRTAALLALLVTPSAWPAFDPVNDDTDIFLANPSYVAARPNVLIFVDNTANWGQSDSGVSKYQGIKSALTSVMNGVVSENFNVGLAMFVETGGSNTGNLNVGAYVRYGIRQMSGSALDTNSNKGRLVSIISGLDETADKSNGARYSTAMSEVFNYYAGRQSYSGFGKTKADAGGSVWTAGGRVALAGSPLPAGGESSSTPVSYTSPIVDGCQKNFIIWISNGEANDSSTTIQQAIDLYQQQTGTAPGTISLNPSGSEGIITDEYARYMANADCAPTLDGVQNIYTYAIDVLPGSSGGGPGHTALLKSMASNGKGKYFPITSLGGNQIEAALNAIFQEVQAVNSVFASTTLPVSVNVRGTNLNQVYIGVFRPDANKSPRWDGNLKLFRLGVNTATDPATLFLADADGNAAENSGTGFISGSARSYWTTNSTYWGFRPTDENGLGGASDSPDGDLVEKGGAGQRLRLTYSTNQSARNLYTCVNTTGGICTDQPNLTHSQNAFAQANANVTAADLGAYLSYSVSSLTSSSTTATLVLSGAPSPTWSAGDQIRVAGATPSEYNGIYALASANNGTFTYTYTLAAALDGSAVQATGTNHGLNTGDYVTVTGTASLDATDSSVTRLDANTFRYVRSGATGTHGAITVVGKKSVTSLTGSNVTATAVVPGHGYSTGNTITISGANEAAFNKTAVITVVDANSFTYSTSPDVISGSASTARASATAHNLSTGQTNVYVLGNTIAGYNGGPKTVTKLDNNSVTFASSEVLAGTGGVIGVRITNFSHPTSGGGNGALCPAGARDVLTVTTDGAHNIIGPFPYGITITGADANYNGTFSIASSADVPSTTTFIIRDNCAASQGPNGAPASTAVAGKPITSIAPIVTASGTILSAKSVSLNGLQALTTAIGSINAGRLADGDATLRSNIIAWVRGQDNKEDENLDSSATDVRAYVHSDVLHSRPAVVNYNRYGDDNDIYAFYGSNDGIFRALKGGAAAHSSGADASIAPGTERWGFIPREFLDKLKRLRDQTPTISSTTPKDYFVDGSIGLYQQDRTPDGSGGCTNNPDGIFNSTLCDKVYLFLSMRRGGDFIYALDVTDPATPKLLWRKRSGDTGWELLGQTWSEPRVAKLQANIGNASNPDNIVLIFGAGYDKDVEDINPCLLSNWSTASVTRKAIGAGTVTYTNSGSCTISGATGGTTTISRTKGRGVLIVDAFDGTVIWQAGPGLTTTSAARAYKLNVSGMTCAIPSDISVLDKARDGYADRLYFGDTCGRAWRVDLANPDPNEWTVTRIADIWTGGSTDIANKRKFLFAPDVVFGVDGVGNYAAVLMGTGDREHPFDTTVKNAFYMFKDRDSSDGVVGATNVTSVKISGFATAPTGSPTTHAGATGVFDATSTEGSNDRGWRIDLLGGEKVVSTAVTLSNITYFNTNQPSSSAGGGSCGSNLGIAREYQVNFADSSAAADLNASGTITNADRSMIHAGGGYLPSPVPVVVEIDGNKYQGVISGTSVQTPPGLVLNRRLRTYWYKEMD